MKPWFLAYVGDPLLPLVEGGAGVGLVGERLADRLVPVVDRLVEERRPLELGVDRAADVGEQLVDLSARRRTPASGR